MTEPAEHLLSWLWGAHAMEQQAEQMLRVQSERLEHYPELKARIDQHLEETLVEQKNRSGMHRASRRLDVRHKGSDRQDHGVRSGRRRHDEDRRSGEGRNMRYVFKKLEITSYMALIVAADRCGDMATKATCERILPQEHVMAQWMLEHIPMVTAQYLERSAARQEAKK